MRSTAPVRPGRRACNHVRMSERTRTSRRAVLLGLAGFGLTGCSIRLEKDAPRVPGVPTQKPPRDAAVLRELVRRLYTVRDAAQGDPRGKSAGLDALHEAQLDRVTKVAASGGIEVPEPTASPSPSATLPSATASSASAPATDSTDAADPTAPATSTTGTSTAPGATTDATSTSSTATDDPTASASQETADSVRTVESAQLRRAWIRKVAGLEDDHRAMAAAVLASHQYAARVLNGRALPGSTALPSADAVAVLAPVRRAVYAAETLAARTKVPDRTKLTPLLTYLHAERMRLTGEAGAKAPPEPLTHDLPDAVTDPTKAQEVLGPLLQDVLTACASRAVTASKPASAVRFVQLWGDTAHAASRWSVTVDAFLGLRA